MTEYQKMQAGETYNFTDAEIAGRIMRANCLMRRLNSDTGLTDEEQEQLMRQLVPGADPTAHINLPFYCDHGDQIRLGAHTFINYGCTMLDSGGIEIGAHCKIGPNCSFYTPQHPMNHLQRRLPVERGLKIRVGDDCWLGGGVTVCPGVTIGNRVIVAAGSVVVHDVPDDVMVAGNPAVIKKHLT